MYEECSEEHKYLLGLRREKNAFTRLIEEHGVCLFLSGGDHPDVCPAENAGIPWRYSYRIDFSGHHDQDYQHPIRRG